MSEPTLTSLHIDQPLSDFSTAYFNKEGTFVWRLASPTIASTKQSNKFFTYTKATTLRSDARVRAPGTAAVDRTFALSNDSFFCDVVSLAYNVSRQQSANADDPLDVERDATQVLTHDIMIKMEADFNSTFMTTSVWGTDWTGGTTGTKWSDPASTPVEDIATAQDTVEAATGQTPNTLIIGGQAWHKALRNHPDIIARLPDNAPRIASTQFLANLLDIDNVVIARAIRNTADEGATAAYSRIVSDDVLLAYVAPNPGPMVATAMGTFTWTEFGGGNPEVMRYEVPKDDAFPRVEVNVGYDFKVIGSDLGYFFTDVV